MFKRDIVGELFVDFCKVFDLADRKVLLDKLALYQFHSDPVSWFYSYIGDRKQCVNMNNTISKELPIDSGIPQGYILGPLLFLMFINNLPLHSGLARTRLVADDVTDSAHGSNIEDIESQLQENINELEQWCISNRMVLNAE